MDESNVQNENQNTHLTTVPVNTLDDLAARDPKTWSTADMSRLGGGGLGKLVDAVVPAYIFNSDVVGDER